MPPRTTPTAVLWYCSGPTLVLVVGLGVIPLIDLGAQTRTRAHAHTRARARAHRDRKRGWG